MATVTKSKEQVDALGDPELIEQHQRVESGVNALLALIERLEAQLSGWDKATLPDRRAFLNERPALVSNGDSLARAIGVKSAFTAEEVQGFRDHWMRVRSAVSGLG